jgi:hypothetical protein
MLNECEVKRLDGQDRPTKAGVTNQHGLCKLLTLGFSLCKLDKISILVSQVALNHNEIEYLG